MAALAAIQAGLGGLQAITGAIQSIGANRRLKKLFAQRTPFQTAKEVFQNKEAAQYFAQQGYSDQTLNYLTNQADRAFSGSTGAALRLGADPNMISGLYDQYMDNIFKIGSDSNIMQMQNFDRFINANYEVARNKDAEWQSRDNFIKDQMQMNMQRAMAGQQNMQSGVNSVLSGMSASQSGKLWNDALSAGSGYGGSGRVNTAAQTIPMSEMSAIAGLMGRRTPNFNVPATPGAWGVDSTLR